jgi:hypothetical protein
MALVRRHLRHTVEKAAFRIWVRAGNVEWPLGRFERGDDGQAFGVGGAFGLFSVFERGALYVSVVGDVA